MEPTLTYFLPCKPGSVYVNVTDHCLNDCLFCIQRDGPIFYGSNLSLNGRIVNPADIVSSLTADPNWGVIKEVVFCGMGEPLLRYDCVMDACRAIKTLRKKVKIRVDTSGLYWASNRRLDILDCIDILSVSLNAENAQKYQALCKSKIPAAYEVLWDFLKNVKLSEINREEAGLHFPEIRLSIVNTAEQDYIPLSGRREYPNGEFPVPDFDGCKKIADDFGWPLIVKRLFRDSREKHWEDRSFEDLCARGVSPDICRSCDYRH